MSTGLYLQQTIQITCSEETTGYELFSSLFSSPFKRSKTSEAAHTSTLPANYAEFASNQERLHKLQLRDYIHNYRQRLLQGADGTVVEDSVDAICDNAAAGAGGGHDGMRLVQLLISCAEAVACRDRAQALALLTELTASALVLGASFHRVASCFVQGLADRLALVHPLGAVGPVTATMVSSSSSTIDAADRSIEALRLAYEVCPYIKFGHFVANASILEAFEGENLVHVVDIGMTLGLPGGRQWQNLLRSLADRGSPPHRVRITGVSPHTGRLESIRRELETYALGLGINLEFSAICSSAEHLKPDDFVVEEGEALAISSILQLHCAVKESRGALNSVLRLIRGLSPKVFVLVEQDSGHNGPFFLGRFMESLHYYSAIFDSLDVLLPRYDTRRAKVEQFYFGEEIRNIVSCEGAARTERHERVDQWRRRMSRAGFQTSPARVDAKEAREWVEKLTEREGFTVAEEKGCMVLGWKSRPIVAASCWKC